MVSEWSEIAISLTLLRQAAPELEQADIATMEALAFRWADEPAQTRQTPVFLHGRLAGTTAVPELLYPGAT